MIFNRKFVMIKHYSIVHDEGNRVHLTMKNKRSRRFCITDNGVLSARYTLEEYLKETARDRKLFSSLIPYRW